MSNSLEKQQKPKRPPRRDSIPLTTAGHVRGEMAVLYRRAKAGEMSVSDASRLVYILKEISQVIKVSDIETRLDALEEAQERSNHDKKFGR